MKEGSGVATILLVDDCEVNRALLAKRLKRHGCRVVEADNGAEALEALREEPIDLAVVDLLMPEVDGFEFVHKLRRLETEASRTPVIYITAAYLPEHVWRLANSCGVTSVLSKKASAEELWQAVRGALVSEPPTATVPPWNEFTLDLLRLFSGTLVLQMKEVIPTLARHLDACEGEDGAGGGPSPGQAALGQIVEDRPSLPGASAADGRRVSARSPSLPRPTP